MGDDLDIDYSLLHFDTYNDYLLSFLKPEDSLYIGTYVVLKKIVKLGYRSKYEPYTDVEFEKRKQMAQDAVSPKVQGRIIFSKTPKIVDDPFLHALKAREEANVQKIISTIIFLTCRRSDGSELSGYIDFEYSCRSASQNRKGATDWEGIFEGRVRLRPKMNHLSYYNSHTHEVRYNDSDNYAVIHDYNYGLMFMHKGDHKIIAMGPNANAISKTAKREIFYSERYGHVVLYDHKIRKKN